MSIINELENRASGLAEITADEAVELYGQELNDLMAAADRLRARFAGDTVDLCSIMNARSGKCSEDCKYCAQSGHYFTGVDEYPLVDYAAVLKQARENESAGVRRFSLVTSGLAVKGKDFDQIVDIYRRLRNDTKMSLCASLGCIDVNQAKALVDVGVTMYHHNLEAGPNYFSTICSTHTFQDRLDTIAAVMEAGMEVCSGGIIGMGESVRDRVEMGIELRRLGVKSVPVNILNPIKGTPLETQPLIDKSDVFRTLAVYRFLMPSAYIRFAGGRARLGADQALAYRAGVNAALVGNLLTTVGNKIEEDKALIIQQGLKV